MTKDNIAKLDTAVPDFLAALRSGKADASLEALASAIVAGTPDEILAAHAIEDGLLDNADLDPKTSEELTLAAKSALRAFYKDEDRTTEDEEDDITPTREATFHVVIGITGEISDDEDAIELLKQQVLDYAQSVLGRVDGAICTTGQITLDGRFIDTNNVNVD